MANYATLKAAIADAIKENGNKEITGNLLQQQLLAMVNSLGVGYQYVGIATPETNPGTPDQNVFYIASTAGTYANFSGLVLNDGEIAILKYNGAWSKESTGAVSNESFSQLEQETIEIHNKVFGISLTQPTTRFHGYISLTGVIMTGANYSVFVDVSTLNGYHITQQGATPGNQYAFLKSKTETQCEFVDGTTRVDAQLNNTLIPDGAKLLYILIGTNITDPIPLLAIVDGEEKSLCESINDLETELENKQDVITIDAPTTKTLTQNSQIFTHESGYYPNSGGEKTALSGYDWYQFVAPNDLDLWFIGRTSGDVILAIYNNGQATTGNFVSPRRRSDGSTETMPTESNKLHITAGQLVVISAEKINSLTNPGGFSFGAYIAEKKFVEGIHLSQTQIDDVNGQNNILVEQTTDSYNITINGYVVNLWHYVNSTRNANCWTIYNVTKDGSIVLPTGTDVVGVLKEIGQDNFMGGYAHGNEQIVDFHIFADGKTLDGNTLCGVVDVFMYSHLYRVSNSAENIIDRYTHIQFKDNNIIVETTFKCLVDNFNLDISYNGGMWAWRNDMATFAVCNIGALVGSGSTGQSLFGLKHELISASALLPTGLVTSENVLGFEQTKYKGEAFFYGNEGATARMKIYYSTDNNSVWNVGHLNVGIAKYTLK